jgi:MFS family permease
VQIGNSIFWVAYQALVSDVAGDGSRERWFALATAVRTAGWAVGGVVTGVVVAVGGRSGYVFIAAANAASFAVSAALMWRPLDGPDRERTERASGREDGRTGWSSVVRDQPFLGFVDANVGLTLLSLALPSVCRCSWCARSACPPGHLGLCWPSTPYWQLSARR